MPLLQSIKTKLQTKFQNASKWLGPLSNTPRLVRLVWAAAPGWLVLSLVLTLLEAVIPTLQLYIGKLIVDQVVALVDGGSRAAFTQQLVWLVGSGLGLMILSEFLQQAGGYAARVLQDEFLLYANVRLLRQAMRLDLAHYESSEFHDVLNRAQQSGSAYPLRVVTQLMAMLGQGTRLAGLLVLLLRFNPLVIGLLLLSAGPTLWVGVRYSYYRFWMDRKQTHSRRLSDYFGEVLTEPQYVKEVRLFNLGHHMVEQYRRIRREFNQESRRLARRQAGAQLGIELIAACGFYGAYAIVLWQALRGSVTVGDLTLYAGTFQQAQAGIEGVLLNIALIYEFNLYVSQYFEFLSLSPRVTNPLRPQPFPTPIRAGLTLEKVCFTYPGASQPTLKEISLSIAPNECIALVGLNGSGKTTLLKLLTRLYDIDQGCISVDDVPLQAFALEDLRRNIGVLFQDFARYALEVQDNIGFGNLPQRHDAERVQRAAVDAGAAEVIEGLDRGYDTVLGKMFSGGVDLSGGQWQKIGLARAFMSEAQILILDEPTAAVDAIAEHDLFQRFRQLTQGKMTFLVSHRFSTVRMADRIVVLEQGQIVEVGTHDDLMARQGRYEEMFRLQAASYTTDTVRPALR